MSWLLCLHPSNPRELIVFAFRLKPPAAIWRRLSLYFHDGDDTQGYSGTPIHSLYRDEVQDFTQAELLLDMRCVEDPNRCLDANWHQQNTVELLSLALSGIHHSHNL